MNYCWKGRHGGRDGGSGGAKLCPGRGRGDNLPDFRGFLCKKCNKLILLKVESGL